MKLLKKSILLLLVLSLTLCSLASCANDEVAMQYGDQELSEADYAYLMAFIKGYYEYYYSYMADYYGYTYDMEALYDQDVGNGKTFADNLTESVTEAAKMLLVVEQLCAEAGLTVEDADSVAEVEAVMQQLEDDYGGRDALAIEMAKLGLNSSSVERYEYYNLLLSLLKDYRYGENGVARIPEEDIQKAFYESYVKAEGYLYSYVTSDSAMYEYDFASEYEDAEVEAFYLANYMIDYVSFEDQSDAEEAYAALSGGTAELSDYFATCDQRAEAMFVAKQSVSETIYQGITETAEGNWYLSGEEDGSYYVIYRRAVVLDDLNEDVEEDVRYAMLTDEAYAYFLENYVTVRHILYSDESAAKEAYESITSGKTSFEDHEKDTEDSGTQYTFAEGVMVDEFETASFELSVGSYTLVETEYGWHIINRLELDESAFSRSDAVAAMTRVFLREEASKQYEAIVGGAAFSEPEEGALYSYSEPALLELASQDERLQEAFKNAKGGEVFTVDLDAYGVFVLRKLETTEEDLSEIYDDVAEPLIEETFYEYLRTFYDAVRVNAEVVDKFDIRTAETFHY